MSDKDEMRAVADMAIGLMILCELVKSKLAPEAEKLEGIHTFEERLGELNFRMELLRMGVE